VKLKREVLLSPPGIFVYYVLASFFGIMGLRLLFPGEPPPLALFSLSWRLTRGILNWIDLFPALAMSAMVIPFGLAPAVGSQLTYISPKFLDTFKSPIITAVSAALVYGVLCFLIYPLAWDRDADMRFRGRLFLESASRARSHTAAGDWLEASRFLGVCEGIWPNSPDLEDLRSAVFVEMEESRFDRPGDQTAAPLSAVLEEPDPSGRWEPVDAAEALDLAETALREERYYDAHWFATLSGRLAREGSVETVEAARTASRAWNAIASLEPNSRETQAMRLYRLKNAAYEAMIAQDWIRGYYLFKELMALTPKDPDVINFLNECEQRLEEIAFFIDESGMTLGEILSGAVFSVPRWTSAGRSYGRMVLQIRSLAASPDYSYGTGVELLVFDEKGELENRLEARYAKVLPRTLGDQKRVLLLLRALDRDNEKRRWEPVWTGPGLPGSIRYDNGLDLGDTQVMLDISYEDFLLSTQVRRGVDNFYIGELFAAERTLNVYGYVSQVFAAEILSRFAVPLYFLALLILTLVIGWRYRAVQRPLYLGIPMLFILPLVFDGVIRIYRAAMNILGIRLILSLSFVPAAVVVFAGALFFFVLFLVCLACQHD
jgi:hypothetical protein